MAEIAGVTAYLNLLRGTYLTVAGDQGTGRATPVAERRGRVVTDRVELSAAALAFLNRTARPAALAAGSALLATAAPKANLIDATLAGRRLDGVDLSGAAFTGADFRGASLANAVLRGASLAGANLTGANLAGADLRAADLTGAAGLTRSQLKGARVDVATSLPIGVVVA